MGNAVVLTEDNFKAEVASGITLVDFWAEWCGPCRMITPILEGLAEEYEGKAKIAKVNVDEAGGLAQEYAVTAIPTLLIMKDGEEVKRFVGVTAKDNLSDALKEAIG